MRTTSLALLPCVLLVAACAAGTAATGSSGDDSTGSTNPTNSSGGAGAGQPTSTVGGGSGGGSTASGTPTGGGPGSGSGIQMSTGSTGGVTEEECAQEAKLVYLLSTQGDIYSFQPEQKQFQQVSRLNCNAPGLIPNSMAIDRNTVAWVNYVSEDLVPPSYLPSQGRIYKVNLKTGECDSNGYLTLSQDWTRVGMGFSMAEGAPEALYVHSQMAGLGKIDPLTGQLSVIGVDADRYELVGSAAELTGTGDGRVFGFFGGEGLLTPFDPASGKILETKQIQLQGTVNWFAFSFYGGDFYLYTSSGDGVPSRVTRVKGDSGASSEFVSNVGFTIAGAGVSTCAPVIANVPQ